eukprot:TRINITY_DN1599_c0_g1_i1.p2 TRINITY_DN1599_c0_g1~~TRINITY_DN1599_c0_g1_i1.p2  ORF type:complete len:175 (+),score=32.34 TRINITY_DN1599_c0_g1_i1:743-1267(+)
MSQSQSQSQSQPQAQTQPTQTVDKNVVRKDGDKSLQVVNRNMQTISLNLETLRKDIQQLRGDFNILKTSPESLAGQSYSSGVIKSHLGSLEKRFERNNDLLLEKLTFQLQSLSIQQTELEKKIDKHLEHIKALSDPACSPCFVQMRSDMEFLQMIVKYLSIALFLVIVLFWYKV